MGRNEIENIFDKYELAITDFIEVAADVLGVRDFKFVFAMYGVGSYCPRRKTVFVNKHIDLLETMNAMAHEIMHHKQSTENRLPKGKELKEYEERKEQAAENGNLIHKTYSPDFELEAIGFSKAFMNAFLDSVFQMGDLSEPKYAKYKKVTEHGMKVKPNADTTVEEANSLNARLQKAVDEAEERYGDKIVEAIIKMILTPQGKRNYSIKVRTEKI